ncbi:MAG: helix-turn-helix domain-containing protein [Acidobacteriota bacterium]|jgi:plasmid maintenance system antidote protein VapI|nr:helix-turn-helix domain-containing protein [Acidobacteriota bacterium]
MEMNLMDYMRERGMTEPEAAQVFGVSQTTVNLVKRGLRRMSPEMASRVSAITGIPRLALLYPNEVADAEQFREGK